MHVEILVNYFFADGKAKRVSLLIRYGADLCLQNNAGFSAFHFINKKVPQCIEALGKYS